MKIRVHYSIFFVFAYMIFAKRLNLFLFFYVFTIFHELIHVLFARAFGAEKVEINFLPIGLNAKYLGALSLNKELIITIAGPIASFVLAIIFWGSTYSSINLIIAIMNLIPVSFFDGGRILFIILVKKCGYLNACRISSKISNFFISLVCFFAFILAVWMSNFFLLILVLYISLVSTNIFPLYKS